MASWPKGVSRRAATALETAGYTPETAASAEVEELILAGISQSSAMAAIKKPPPDEIERIRAVTGRYPPKAIWATLVESVTGVPTEALMAGWQDHLMGGGNPVNYAAWLGHVAYHNRPVLQIGGVKPPPDWQEVIEHAEAIQDKKETVPWQAAYAIALNNKANGL